MKHLKRFFCTFTTLLILSQFSALYSLSLSDISTTISTIFQDAYSDNEGLTSFRSLLIPIGGRSESLGSAYTGLSDDAAYINFNPAAACILKDTQMGVFHNAWISDSKMETLAYTTRYKNFGFGTQLSCFYVPFTEYNLLGERTAGNYYSETNISVNAAYNHIAGYDFKGLAVGSSIKAAWRSVPNFTDNDTNEIIPRSGLSQSSLALMADLGLMLQFNFLKYFSSRDPNVRIGFTLENFGAAVTGFGTKLQMDDPLPTFIGAGISVKFLPIITASVDIKQPINLYHITQSSLFSLSAGASIDFTKDFSLLAGLELKGGNPRISVGSELEINNTRFNLNYTLDLTSSVSPVNRISLSARIMLGDRGRQEEMNEIDKLYLAGLQEYYLGNWEEAIEEWNKILTIYNKRYDPAIAGIASAQSQIDMLEKARESMFFSSEE